MIISNFSKAAAQGDIYLYLINRLPKGLTRIYPINNLFIIGHSETGHHHIIEADPKIEFYTDPKDDMKSYLVVKKVLGTILKHQRNYDTHAPIEIQKGIYGIRRQREYAPKGWRRVVD